MEWLDTILSSPYPAAVLIMIFAAGIIFMFSKGWVVTAPQIKLVTDLQNLRIVEAIKRGDDYKTAWELSEKRGDTLQALLDKTTIIGISVDKLLSNLPTPQTGDKEMVE